MSIDKIPIRLDLRTRPEVPVIRDAVAWFAHNESISPHPSPMKVAWQMGYTANGKALVMRVRADGQVRDFTIALHRLVENMLPPAFNAMLEIGKNMREGRS